MKPTDFKISNLTPNHKDANGKPVIQVTFAAVDGMHTFNAYYPAEDAAPFSAAMLNGDLFTMTLEPKKVTA